MSWDAEFTPCTSTILGLISVAISSKDTGVVGASSANCTFSLLSSTIGCVVRN